MNIGIVTTWFERGAAHVSRQFMDALIAEGHSVYIFARGGEEFATGDKYWDLDNITWNSFRESPVIFMDMDKKQYLSWLKNNGIEAVLFNEQHYWQPILWTKAKKIKCIAYVDYYTAETIPFFDVYDELWCNTKRHAAAFENHRCVKYIPWGTDVNLYRPSKHKRHEKLVFFHSAGMNPYRKGTDILLRALKILHNSEKSFTCLIHTQKDLMTTFPNLAADIKELMEAGVLEIINKTIGVPGLYHKGDVYVYPARLDGIGLTVPEAIACGLAVVVPNNGPMNEFVTRSFARETPIMRFETRTDNYFWDMGIIGVKDLASDLRWFLQNKDKLESMKQSARSHALTYLDFKKNISFFAKTLTSERTPYFVDNVISEINGYERKKTRFYKSVPKLIRWKTKWEKNIKSFWK